MTDNEKKDDVTLQVKKPSIGGDDKTAKIPKINKPGTPGSQKVVMNAASNSSIKPSDVTKISPAVPPGAEETIQMDKSEVKDIPEIAGLQNSTDDSTQKTLKPPAPISKTAKSKTIKLKPLKPINATEDNQEETLSMDRNALIDEEMPSLGAPSAPTAAKDPGLDDEATIKIQKPVSQKPTHPTPAIPGSKETIKLRPSTAAAPAAKPEDNMATVSMSKKTIRLVPKQPGTSNDATQVAAKPSAPTVQLGAPPPAPAAPAAVPPPPPAAPSAPTVKMPEPAPAPAAPPAAASSGKKTLKLKATPKPPAAGAPAPPAATGGGTGSTETDAPAQNKKGKAPKEKVTGADPGIVMTLVAFITLILMVYCTWMTIGSWAEGEKDMTKNAKVPFLSQTVQPPK